MRDRQPTKVLENGALRYGVYDETGVLLRYEYLALEDAPSDVGTDLSKANLLTDDTETALFGSAADRTINETFAGIAGQLKLIMSNVATITLTLKDSAGAAIPGVLVQGILSESGQSVYSNSSGVASGYISEGSQTIKVTGYADIADYSETISVTKGTSITKTITLTTRNFLKITSSKSVKFSGNVNAVDVTAVGGGGGGKGSRRWMFPGGGGGYCTVNAGIAVTANTLYPAVVGAGGYGSYRNGKNENPTNGGSSSFLGVSASGGHGGVDSSGNLDAAGNGSGGYVTESMVYRQPVAGNVAGYASFTGTVLYGGGGGGGFYDSDDSDVYMTTTQTPYGGPAGWFTDALDGMNGFGGGGGGSYAADSLPTAGNGGSGCVAIRMHLKSAA